MSGRCSSRADAAVPSELPTELSVDLNRRAYSRHRCSIRAQEPSVGNGVSGTKATSRMSKTGALVHQEKKQAGSGLESQESRADFGGRES